MVPALPVLRHLLAPGTKGDDGPRWPQRPPTRPTCSPPSAQRPGPLFLWVALSSPAHASFPLLSPVLSVDHCPPTLSHLPQLLFSSGWISGPHLSFPRPERCPVCPVFGLHPSALLTQMWHDRVGSEGGDSRTGAAAGTAGGGASLDSLVPRWSMGVLSWPQMALPLEWAHFEMGVSTVSREPSLGLSPSNTVSCCLEWMDGIFSPSKMTLNVLQSVAKALARQDPSWRPLCPLPAPQD